MTGKTTRRPSRRSLVTMAAVVLTAGAGVVVAIGPAAAAGTVARPVPDTAAVRRLEGVADTAMAAGVPGLIVRVNDGHGPAVSIVRQAAWTRPDHVLTEDAEFRMGSNTKTLTATLVLQLVAQHRLSLDDTIEKWLPGAVPNGRHITLRMLLQHTSGLADYAYTREALDLMTGRAPNQPGAAELLALGTSLPPVSAPGEGWNYSNTGYVALGLVLQKATGHSVSDLIQQRIAGPLGLRHTYLPTNGAGRPDAGRLAEGYEPDAAGMAPLLPPGLPAGYGFVGPEHDNEVDVTGINQSWDGAAGAIVSTTSDWATFDTALMTGRLFPKSLLGEMRTVVDEDELSGPNYRYGLGLEQYNSPCGIVWGHDGALPGYRSDNYTDPSGQRTMSVLATTHFGLKANPAESVAEQNVVDAAICTMLDKPVPATS